MMKKTLWVISAFVIIILTACNNNRPDIDTSLINTTSIGNTSPVVNDTTNLPGSMVMPNPAVTLTGASIPTATPVAVTNAARLNPPHGQPGHDCAIAVGAPLNGKPTNGGNPGITTTPPASSVISSPINAAIPGNAFSGRLNPPHGQPGHDCAIAVGQPLP